MPKQLFEVQNYDLHTHRIEVDLLLQSSSVLSKFRRSNFETWLDNAGRLTWEMNYSDSLGNHTQANGNMSTKEYWSKCSRESIIKDLYDYIVAEQPDKNFTERLNNTLSIPLDDFTE